MAKTSSQLLAVAKDCHTSFHKEMCSPVDLFQVHHSYTGVVFLVPNLNNHIYSFFGNTMTFIADYLNSHGVTWSVIPRDDSVAIRLWND